MTAVTERATSWPRLPFRPATPLAAVADLWTAAQRGPGLDDGVAIESTGDLPVIRFESRDRYHAWCDFGLIQVENAFYITVEGANVHVPVLFDLTQSTLWRAVAVFPAQVACVCAAEVVHQIGCPEIDDQDTAVYEAALRFAPECVECGCLNGSHQAWCFAAASALPVVVLDVPIGVVHELLPYAAEGEGELTCGQPYTGSRATTVVADVTCPTCARWALPQRQLGAALAADPPLELLASVLVEEVAE